MSGVRCIKCGKASVAMVPTGEDQWEAVLTNATGVTCLDRRDYTCNACGSLIDHADPAMISSEREATP